MAIVYGGSGRESDMRQTRYSLVETRRTDPPRDSHRGPAGGSGLWQEEA